MPSTQQLTLFVLLIVLVGIPITARVHSEEPGTLTISAEQILNAKVIGSLGKPLGTLLVVEGRYKILADQADTKSDESDEFILKIDRVDGQPLSSPVEYRLSAYTYLKALSVENDQAFKIIGYETGCFFGDVEGAHRFERTFANNFGPHRFKFRFEFLRDELQGISQRDLLINRKNRRLAPAG